jgi:hypothetical protein
MEKGELVEGASWDRGELGGALVGRGPVGRGASWERGELGDGLLGEALVGRGLAGALRAQREL